MAMKKNNRDYIAQMNKGMKQKLSMLLIACLLFTGYHGLTISGRAEQEEKEQTNEISVSGTQVKVQLLGEDIRRAAKEAIEKGDRVEAAALQGYSGDEDLQKEYAEIFSSEKEVYEIPLDSISEGLSESLAEEEAGLQVFVERDAKDLERLVRKESKESLLLYDKNSQLSQLFPETKQEETKSAVEKEEESGAEEVHASDSNIEKTERNTELTGSELITFLYKNKADHRISFQLSVDGNTYPKVVVSPKTQLFKSFLDKLKKEEKKPQAETTVVASTEAKASTAAESTETEATASAEETEESESESAASSVSLVSTEGSVEETTVAESTVVETAEAESAEESAETKEHTTEVTEETEATEETAAERKATETVKEKKENFTGFLQEVISHYEEFLGELETARFAQYSLNELGRKTQNVEIKDFATVEVFYDEDAFDEDVVLEAKRLVKPEEEGKKEGEKLTEEQIKLMQDTGIYKDSDSLDIRFVKNGEEVEPKEGHPVTVRLTFYKEAVPEEASSDTISIHHIVEDGEAPYVETVLRSEVDKKAEKAALGISGESVEKDTENIEPEELEREENSFGVAEELSLESPSEVTLPVEEEKSESKENITKEFTVSSFSVYVVNWYNRWGKNYELRFHYVDRNFREIAPTKYTLRDDSGAIEYYNVNNVKGSLAYKEVPNYYLQWVGSQTVAKNSRYAAPYSALTEGYNVDQITSTSFQRTNVAPNSKSETYYYNKFPDCSIDFYFIYNLYNCPQKKTHDFYNEKFLTDNLNGTYDLTLTAQVEKKTDLDVVFVYDNTAIMATDFNFKEKDTKLSKMNYAPTQNAKSAKVKMELENFMHKLSANPVYDVRYALVTMDGDKSFGNIYDGARAPYPKVAPFTYLEYKNEAFKRGGNQGDINIVGEYKGAVSDSNRTLAWLSDARYDDGKSFGFNVTDTPYNDTKNLHGFTDHPQDIINQLAKLNEKVIDDQNNMVSGENYESAIKNVKVLLGQGGEYQVPNGGVKYRDEKARENAEKIVVFITGGNPKFSYIAEDGIYDDTYRFDNKDEYYRIRRNYEEGWSFGNGYTVDYAALNTARGELHSLTNVDAFYSIGVGNTENYKYLNDFAMGQYFNKDGIDQYTPEAKKQHPDRRGKALLDGVRYKCFDASSPNDLKSAFNVIYDREIKNDRTIKNVEITDILTKYVQPVPKSNVAVRGQLVKMKPNTYNSKYPDVEVDHIVKDLNEMKNLGLKGFKTSAELKDYKFKDGSGNSTTEKRWYLTLETIPADFTLPAGYDIRMVATVEQTDEAKRYFQNNSVYPNTGEKRTDLNDIYETYLGKPYEDKYGKPASMFNTSVDKRGLFTNEDAWVRCKIKHPDYPETPPKTRKYNKPIIKPKEQEGNLTIKKTFKGLEGTKFLEDSTGNLTQFGKEILQQIIFKVKRQDGSVVKDMLDIDFANGPWLDEFISFKEGKFIKGKDGKDYKVTIEIVNKTEATPQLNIKIDNLDLNKKYQVWEIIGSNENTVKADAVSDGNITYKYKEGARTSISQTITTATQCTGIFSFTNTYEKVQPKKFVTIKKQVEEFGRLEPSDTEKAKQFEFAVILYTNDGLGYVQPLNADAFQETYKLQGILNQGKTKGEEGWVEVKRLEVGGEGVSSLNFKLSHNQSIQIPIPAKTEDGKEIYFRVLEKKEDEYQKVEIKAGISGQPERGIPAKTENFKDEYDNINGVYKNTHNYTYTQDVMQNLSQTITFHNHKQLTIPTGLVRDITPYLFSIFGFTLMAGVYFVINKKKRREI